VIRATILFRNWSVMAQLSLSRRKISETSVAVIDFETTGLTPGFDRVVEVSVVRIDPGQEPKLVFDTLINPSRPMAATEIHGITDRDVQSAPRFQQIVGEFFEAVNGCVIAAYNVYFDMRFFDFEVSNAGVRIEAPHFCLMYLRPMLGLGSRCRLDEACKLYGINYSSTHVSSVDSTASAWLYLQYLNEIERQRVNTFADLARLRTYKFNQSFSYDVLPSCNRLGLSRFDRLVSRSGIANSVDPTRQAMSSYWDTLKTVLADLEISPEELEYALRERRSSQLSKEQIRAMHARAFASIVSQFASDEAIDDKEVLRLRKYTNASHSLVGLQACSQI
jgi:DNA polymerase-3 subunit epsilon